MKSVILEVRDRMTLIPVMATLLSNTSGENEYENKLMNRAGYGDPGLVLLTKLDGAVSECNMYNWGIRTMFEAHKYIAEHFDDLKSGDVIDIEYILGERDTPKTSEVNY